MKIDLRDPDTWAALERQAYEGTVNVLPLPAPAYKYFSELTAVYRAFRFEGMPKEEAEARKRLLLKDYQRQVQEIRQAREVYAEYQNAVRTAGTLTSEIEKSQSVFEIAERACKIIGLLIGDSSFCGRQIRKFTCEGVEIKKQTADNEYDMLKGCMNRMFVTKDPDELMRMYQSAIRRIDIIRQYNTVRIAKEEATNENNT